MLHLHYYPSTASMVPHIVLEELAVPYQRVLVDRAVNAHKSPEYLKLNPNGLIAVLVQDGMAGGAGAPLVLYETAAIVLHLCDTHLGAGLAPPVGSAERAHFYKWLMWLTNTLQATLIVYFYPERWVAQGRTRPVRPRSRRRSRGEKRRSPDLLDQLDAAHGTDWHSGFGPRNRSTQDRLVHGRHHEGHGLQFSHDQVVYSGAGCLRRPGTRLSRCRLHPVPLDAQGRGLSPRSFPSAAGAQGRVGRSRCGWCG
jgi:glutathione S-transferase